MAGFVEGVDRGQSTLFPAVLDEEDEAPTLMQLAELGTFVSKQLTHEVPSLPQRHWARSMSRSAIVDWRRSRHHDPSPGPDGVSASKLPRLARFSPERRCAQPVASRRML
jgi:hypothetical protein